MNRKMKVAFIGHRNIICKGVTERLYQAVETEVKDGCLEFSMGTHGEFDSLALSVCRQLRRQYSGLEIEVVLTSLHTIAPQDYVPYSDVKTVLFDIEEAHFKRRITLSNRLMIDGCDTLICYVDTKRRQSGAKTAMNYAKRKGLKIINLYREEDEPFYGMTKEEIEAYMNGLFAKL
jgi:hypothetical protein